MTGSSDILLVCMPFGGVFSPSIGLSLLKAELAAQGLSARVLYFSIRFAEQVGQDFYYRLAVEDRPPFETLAGEWIFSRALFGARVENEAYLDDILRTGPIDARKAASPALIERIRRARREVDGFLDWCRGEVVEARPKLVGFSSMFQQHVASLALARIIKESLPETFLVFGGANCDDVMGAETIRQFRFVDAVVSGEGDLVLPELARRVLEGRPVSGLPGVRTRDVVDGEFSSGRFSHAPIVQDLDALPYPDYSDYFEQFEASRYGKDWQPRISVETSRGCWWGEKRQCTFCGLNPRTMEFRSKSTRRAMDELAWLARRHPGCPIDATDNILDMRYLRDFVPQLAAKSRHVELFYEVKANLRKEHLRLLRDANIRSIQPGIESFSNPVLKIMRKGVSALQNIQLLKWCKELGIDPAWNLIWGFPGEPPEEYARMADLVPLLAHLPPPDGHGVLRLDRFSPHYEDAQGAGLVDVKPVPPYRYVYPFAGEVLDHLASFFTFEYREPRDVGGYVARLERNLLAWARRHEENDLFSVDRGECLLVWDLRPVSRAPLTVLHGVDCDLYRACDAACDAPQLARSVASGAGPVSPNQVARRLEPLLQRGLMVKDDSRYLALAIPLGEYSPPGPAVGRFYEVVRALGRKVRGGWVISPEAARAAATRDRPSFGAKSFRAGRRRRPRRLRASQFSVNALGEVRIRRIPSR